MKKLLLLGGDHFLLPVVKKAKELGYYVITADYLPDNIAHKFSDEYANISTIDKDAVYKFAANKQVDGILTYTDSGAMSAAYACDKLGLPMPGPYESIEILQNKDKFRHFLSENGFNTPKAKGYRTVEEALHDVSSFHWPIIVKPVDSAASKGVTKVSDISLLKKSIEEALTYSRRREFIIEEYIESFGSPSDADCFSVGGQLLVTSFSSQMFDVKAANPFTPAAFYWPADIPDSNKKILANDLQRLLSLLQMRDSIYNVESRIGVDGKAYLMEVSPRGGGNRLAEMVRYTTGVDLIEASIYAAIGEPISICSQEVQGYWGEVVLHASQNGIFQRVEIDNAVQMNVIDMSLWVSPGAIVTEFTGGNKAIGNVILKFESYGELLDSMKQIESWLRIVIE